MKVPFVNLEFQTQQIRADLGNKWDSIVASSNFILGEEVEKFEKNYANFLNVKYCVGVANGTEALELALRAIEVKAGDEVILPANSFIASALSVVRIGARPIFIDCNDSYLMDVEKIKNRISSKTKAIIAVHLFGQSAEIEKIKNVIKGTKIKIVEDAAQAQGARRFGNFAGALGDVAATSFYPGKNLGAFGDAGAVTTDSKEIYLKIKKLRNYGSEIKYNHPVIGFNSRLDSIQAAVLNCKLDYLHEWNAMRKTASNYYISKLTEVEEIVLPKTLEDNEHVWHLFVIRVKKRTKFISYLNSHGVECGIHYPKPIHQLGAFKKILCSKSNYDLKNSEEFSREIVSLPLFPGITKTQLNFVIKHSIEGVLEK